MQDSPIHCMTRRSMLTGGVTALTACCLPRLLTGQSEPMQSPNVDALVRAYMKRYCVPGMSISIRRGALALYTGNFGNANRDTHEDVHSSSLFRIASNSKAFTSVAILVLAERGKLTLQDRVFAPDGIFPQYAKIGAQRDWLHAITIHDLLTHTTGGWANERNDPMFEQPDMAQEQLIAWTIATFPLQNPPGQKYSYSNFGYCILGRVIEHVAGEPYEGFVKQNVMNPIGIEDMLSATQKPALHEVHYYGQGREDPYNIPITRMDSHGGWISTAGDMSLFLAALFSPRDHVGCKPILSTASLSTMTQGTKANPGYACGLAVNQAGNAWHAGSLPGTMSLMVHTNTGLSWSAALNTRSTDPQAATDLDSMLWTVAHRVPTWHA